MDETEIRQTRPAVCREQNVLGLDVTVNETRLMSVIERPCDFRRHARRGIRRHRPLRYDLGKRAALDQLHGEVEDTLSSTGSEDRHDSGVLEPRRRSRLAKEANREPLVERRAGRQHLQRDSAAERFLLGLVDDPHAATPELADEPEITEPRASRKMGRQGLIDRPGFLECLVRMCFPEPAAVDQEVGEARL